VLHNVFHRFLYRLTWPLRALLYPPSRILAGSRRLAGMSLPAKMAWLSFFLLVLCVVVSLVAFGLSIERAHFWAKVTPRFIVGVTILVILIPWVLYKALKLWLEGDVSPYPDIDEAWRAGLAELESKNLPLNRIPLFLVLGVAGEQQEQSLFDAARLELEFRGVPEGKAPLHWYAGEEGVYLVCTRIGHLSHLAASPPKHTMGGCSPPTMAPPLDGTLVGSPADEAHERAEPGPPTAPASPQGPNVFETLAAVPDPSSSAAGRNGTIRPPGRRPAPRRAKPDPEVGKRMRYLLGLIRKERHPLAPVNGALTLLPFGLLDGLTHDADQDARRVQEAARSDLDAVRECLKIRCPVIPFVTGLENEPGFGELVRRVGHERALGTRFGKGFDPETPPLDEHLAALCAHACGAFEDWVYLLFREKGALSKPGNTKLYALLCKIRRFVKDRLEDILVNGYGITNNPSLKHGSPDSGPLFSGCYFGAIGETDDRQAFVHSVFRRLQGHDKECLLAWPPEALQEDERRQRLAHWGLAVDLGLLVALGGLVIYYWWVVP